MEGGGVVDMTLMSMAELGRLVFQTLFTTTFHGLLVLYGKKKEGGFGDRCGLWKGNMFIT